MNAATKTGMIVLVYLALSLFAYANLPDKVAVHWDSAGNANGYATKLWGIGLFPLIGVFIHGILVLAPILDPKKKNIQKFAKEYGQFCFMLQGFFVYLFILFIAWNMGYTFSFVKGLIPAFVVLMFYLGGLLEHAKQNYFIGIRTPWTLENEKVWNETHARTGKLLKIVAFLPLIGWVSGKGQIEWLIIPLVAVFVYGGVLSYLLYRKYTRKK